MSAQKSNKILAEKKRDRDSILSKIAEIPLRLRSTLRSMAHAIQEPKTTVYRIFKEGMLKRVSNSLKPLLKGDNYRRRIEFALSFVDRNSLEVSPVYEYVHDSLFMLENSNSDQ